MLREIWVIAEVRIVRHAICDRNVKISNGLFLKKENKTSHPVSRGEVYHFLTKVFGVWKSSLEQLLLVGPARDATRQHVIFPHLVHCLVDLEIQLSPAEFGELPDLSLQGRPSLRRERADVVLERTAQVDKVGLGLIDRIQKPPGNIKNAWPRSLDAQILKSGEVNPIGKSS